jgi:hypothetical protein
MDRASIRFQRSASGRSMIMCGQFLLQVVHHCDTVLYQYIDLVQFNGSYPSRLIVRVQRRHEF